MPLSRPRLALATVLLSLLAVFVTVSPATTDRARAEEYDGIAGVALRYVGQHGGQCWTFVQQVVLEATGRQMGFDYRQGYFDAGAVEVSLQEARAGDIIQIIGDYTGPDADYPGMHTAIVLENHGDGTFTVVDSNRNWDEMVSVHDGYDPANLAANSGLNFHIYRIEGGSGSVTPPPAPRVASDPTQLKVGDTVEVVTPGEYLNLRSSPAIGDNIVGKLYDRARLTVLAGPVAGGDLLWVRVSAPAGDGWVAAKYLALVKPGVPASGGDSGSRPITMPFRTILPGIAFGE